MRRSRRWGTVAAAIAATAIGAAAVIAAGASGFGAQTVNATCTLTVPGSPAASYQRTLVVRADTPDTVAVGGRVQVDVAAEPENLPMTSPHPQFVAGYANVRTRYLVSGGNVDANSINVTLPATINGAPVTSDVTAAGNVVDVNVQGPIPSGSFQSPAVTFDVIPGASAAHVDVQATEHLETTNFSGPGPATSGVATCPLGVSLATTAITGTSTTTVQGTSTSTSTDTSTTTPTTSPEPPTSTTTTSDPTTTTTAAPTTTTTATTSTTTTVWSTVPTVSVSDAAVWEPAKGRAAMVFTVTLSEPATHKVVVNFTTVDDTATEKDYVATSGKIRFRPGETEAPITVRIRSDKISDPNEFLWLDLFDPSGATLARARGLGWIVGG